MPAEPVRVLMFDPMPSWTVARLRREFEVFELPGLAGPANWTLPDPETIRAIAMPGFVAVPGEVMAQLPKLEIAACFGVGYDGVDLDYTRAHGIVVSNTPDVLTECVADLGIALVLACYRRIAEGDRYVRAGRWEREGILDLGRSPRGKRLGIVGLGRIGMALAKRAEAFGMSIAYHNRASRGDVDYAYCDSPATLAAECDVLALTCPGGPATQNLIDAEVLAALGPEGWLVNIARGSVVDQAALVRALQAGQIAGAGLDVFADEPRVPDELMSMENVVLQPHQASATVETRTAMGDLMIDNLLAHFQGRPLPTPVA